MKADGARGGPFRFEVGATSGRARAGTLRTPHGEAATPAFMAVGTAATVKALTPEQIARTGTEIVLCNTYHLAVRPGEALIEEAGGLHAFMGWDGPILTDSGGFQIFSLASAREVDRDGVTFKNHVDGGTMRLTPERAMEIQRRLGSDVAMVLDECLPYPSSDDVVRESLRERTLPWEIRSLACHPRDGRAVFAIGQGGFSEELRRECIEELVRHPFDGFAIGGLAVGETRGTFLRMIDLSAGLLPPGKPRYLMGVGSPREVVEAIALGVDLFDCVLPTRNARNGQALTAAGPVRLRNAAWARDRRPLEDGCGCEACRIGLSRAYLRHLFLAGEMLAGTLVTSHNLAFLQRLLGAARRAIRSGEFARFSAEFLAGYPAAPEAADAP
jgi:queuine tRNA-ribosyltransferase